MSETQETPSQPQNGSASPLRGPRAGEQHAAPPAIEWGEGVVTGDPPSHYVHLANGAVVEGSAGGTHHHDPEYGLIPIVAVYPKGA